MHDLMLAGGLVLLNWHPRVQAIGVGSSLGTDHQFSRDASSAVSLWHGIIRPTSRRDAVAQFVRG
jgi:hypothetical protein